MKSFWQKLDKPILALAPMAGYTDSAFRQICRKEGAHVVYSEMLSIDAICFNNAKTLKMLAHNKSEYPLVIQLFGNDPAKFAKAVKIINKKIPRGSTIGIDINFGCPAHKVVKNGSGSALMNEIDKAYNIIKAVCSNTCLPVSIKIRAKAGGVDAIQFLTHVKNLPWQTVMIHGRTLKQGFVGVIDFEIIKKIKSLFPDRIVLANGNIYSKTDIEKTLVKTEADGIGIARGAWGNPWIFSNNETDWETRKKMMLHHAKLALKYLDNLEPLRKHLIHYVRGLKNARELRASIIKVKSLKDLNQILK